MRPDRRASGLAAVVLLALGSAPLLAQSLTLGEVLSSARQHTPQVLEAIARVRAAEGRRLATDGAFDIVFKGDAESRLDGFYDGKWLGAGVSRPLQTRGGELFAGYRVSDGRFPIYEDERYTNQLGELKAGIVFALLRDLLALAEGRQDGLRRQVSRGLKPTILLVENDQTVLRRKSLVVEAEQALAIAASRLSLYLRDEAGVPMTPTPTRLPSGLPPAPMPSADARTLAASRPDLKAIDLRMQQARERLALTRNSALPRLDLVLETSRDFGDVGPGGPSRSGTEPRIGLRFSVPLQQRSAKGQLAVAERRRFELGASDLFLVQVREEAEASARIRAIESAWRETQARAELAAVTADLPALGL